MKAKVIKTGEIVDVYHESQHGQITNIYKESVLVNGRMWDEEELDFNYVIKANKAPENVYLQVCGNCHQTDCEGCKFEDLEDFALQYAGHHAPYDDCMEEVVDAVKAGANWQKQQDKQPISDDLSAEIDYLSKRYPEVSFAKLTRIAVHVAKWQMQHIMRQ